MSKELAVLATVGAGGLVAAQAPVNNILSKKVGTFGAGSVNFLVGTAMILVITFVFAGGLRGDEGAQSPAWYYWVFGGFAGVTSALIAGQLTLSVVLDRLGVLGLEERAVTWDKLLGIALLAVGTLLIVRD